MMNKKINKIFDRVTWWMD